MPTRTKGFLSVVCAAVILGFVPLFIMPLLKAGIDSSLVLFYRLLFAAMGCAAFMKYRGMSLRLKSKNIFPVFVLSCLYTTCIYFLVWGYTLLSTGVAVTIHFLYPVYVSLIMVLIFHEKLSLKSAFAMIFSIIGVGLLCIQPGENKAAWGGVLIVQIAAFCYALYLVGIQKTRVAKLDPLLMTFYVLLSGAVISCIGTLIQGTFSLPPMTLNFWGNMIALGFVATSVANLFLIFAIQKIGPTVAAVLGALEPLTAVIVGVLAFSESLTLQMGMGVVCVLLGVILIIVSKAR